MPFEKKVLFVQPDTELFYAAKEAEQVVNLLDANLLTGSVRVNDLVDRIREFQPQLIIISSHGKDDGILLSDGIIGSSNLKKIFSTSDDLECVYLNTCSSILVAVAIHKAMPVDFVFSLAEVPDKHAFVSMSTFAYHLSEGHTYGSAWFESRGGNGSGFMFLPSVAALRGTDGIDGADTDYHMENSREYISLKEYIDTKHDSMQRYIDTALEHNRTALNKAEIAMAYRLEGMNEFRSSLQDQTKQYATRGEVESMRLANLVKFNAIEKNINIAVGALAAFQFVIIVAGILWTVFG
jgi:hypothetical protein